MSDIEDFIGELYQKRSWFNKRSKGRKIQALKSISAFGSPFTVPSIFQFVFSWNTELSHETALTIHELMSKVKPSQWTQLYPAFQYIDIFKKQLRFLCQFPDSLAVDLLGIASLNGNGHVRQEAICELQKTISLKKISYIMLRLGDWVPQVRERAESAFIECLKQGYAEAFMSYTYILDWMTRVERVDLSPIHDQIIDYLTSSTSKDYLRLALDHADKRVRLFSYKALLSKSPYEPELIEKGAKDPNPKIRWNIFQNIINLPAEHLTIHLPVFIQDSSPKICSSVMMAIPEDQWQDFRSTIFENMFSNSPSIRNTARFLLKRHGFSVFADEYRKRIESEVISPGILSGLAETGSKDDFVILKHFANHPKSKIRSATIAGLYRLDAEQSIPYLIEALRDSIARVRRTSSNILCKYRRFDRDSVRRVLRDGASASKISALKVLCDSSSWDAIEDIFLMITDGDETVKITAWNNYIKWLLKRSVNNWVKPSQAVLCLLEAKIEELNSKKMEIPDFAKRAWRELPSLIESGKQVWKY